MSAPGGWSGASRSRPRSRLTQVQDDERAPVKLGNEPLGGRLPLAPGQNGRIHLTAESSGGLFCGVLDGIDLRRPHDKKVNVPRRSTRFSLVAACPRSIDERGLDARYFAQERLQYGFGAHSLEQQTLQFGEDHGVDFGRHLSVVSGTPDAQKPRLIQTCHLPGD